MKKVSTDQIGSFCGLLCNASNVVSMTIDSNELQFVLENQRSEFTEEFKTAMSTIFATLKASRQQVKIPSKKFRLVKEFLVIVPDDYDHGTHLASFKKKNEKSFYYYNPDITDEHYANVTTKLTPGRRLMVKVFEQAVHGTTTSEERIAFLKSQKAIFTGAQGASLVWEQQRAELPKGKWYTSLDEKEALWKDADLSHRVPDVGADADDAFRFALGVFEGVWGEDNDLLCFCNPHDFSRYLW